MPGSAATTAGTALTQWVAVATTPGLRARPAAMDSGCQPWKVTRAGRVPGHLHLEPLTFGPEGPGRVQVLLAHEPVGARR